MASSVLALKELLEQRFPGAQPLRPGGAAAPLETGIAALDGMLPGGGLPRGRLTLWRPGGGATAVLRAACRATVERGERAAWVDVAGVVVERFAGAGVALLRPEGGVRGLECAEELLRSGGFALVVLGGVGRTEAAEVALVRLSRVAREGGGALVVLAERSPVAALRVGSRLRPEDYRWRPGPFGEAAEVESVRVRVRAVSPGWSGETAFCVPVASWESRLALDARLVDRRGVTGRERWRAGGRTGVLPPTGQVGGVLR